MCLENSFPKKTNAKFCSLNIISKVNRVISVLLDYDLFSYSVLYPIQSLQLKQKQQPDQMMPSQPHLPHVCMCVWRREMLAFKQVYIR